MVCGVGRIQGLAAAAGLVIVISATVPGLAADTALRGGDTAVKVASVLKHPRGALRNAMTYPLGRGLHLVQGRPGCAGSGIGRQFLLMVGVAY